MLAASQPGVGAAIAAAGRGSRRASKAFMNYYLFDNNYNLVDAGFVQISEKAAIHPAHLDAAHEELRMAVAVEQPGYLMTSLSYDEPSNADVYFDDYTVTHVHGQIVQMQDYYPYGLAYNKKIQENEILNKYLYQGKEVQDSTGWHDFHARLYSPALGRFLGADPKGQFHSPYLAMGNNPVIMVDPDGEIAFLAVVGIAAAIGGISGGIAAKDMGYSTFGGIWRGALVGAAAGAAGAGVAVAGGGAVLAGAAGGAVGGAGFSGMATGWDGQAMLTGAWQGALAGAVGGGIGSLVGGGTGAFLGSATSDITGQLLATGDVNFLQAGISGAAGLGMYHVNGYLNYKSSSLKDVINYKQFAKISTDFQRSRVWKKEFGGIATSDGSIIRAPAKYRHNLGVDFDPAWTSGAIGKGDILFHYHTHWAKAGLNFTVNANLDFANHLEILLGQSYGATSVHGPSPGDYQFAQQTGVPGIIIDRVNVYSYGYRNGSNFSNILSNASIIRNVFTLPFWFR